jgi:hypothetical protein
MCVEMGLFDPAADKNQEDVEFPHAEKSKG